MHFSTITCTPQLANFFPSTSASTRRAKAHPEPPQPCLFFLYHLRHVEIAQLSSRTCKVPIPSFYGHLSSSTTDISIFKVDLLETEWKAKVAVRDDILVQKLCDALEDILGDAPLGEGAENYLLASFSPRIQVDELGREDMDWSSNSNERHVSFSGCSSFEAEQFRAGPGGRLGGCYTRGSFLPQAKSLGIRSISL